MTAEIPHDSAANYSQDKGEITLNVKGGKNYHIALLQLVFLKNGKMFI